MTPRASRRTLQAVALHAVALAILLWPLAGVAYVPMVDLPGHLAITRVLDDYLHGKYRTTLQLNLDPVHKPTYVLLYALFTVLPKAAVGPVAAALMLAGFYAAVCHGIAALGRRSASSPLVVSLALLIAMFCFSSAFFWGLIPFMLSVPPALIAYVSYLRASGVADASPSRRRTCALAFVATALFAHLVHPLSSLFLAIMVGSAAAAAAGFALVGRGGARGAARLGRVAWPLVAWASAVATLHFLTAPGGHEQDLARSLPALAAPFHGVAAARAFLAQIPVELAVLPTRDRASTWMPYPDAVALVLSAAGTIALVAALRRRAGATAPEARRAAAAALRLAVVFGVSALVLLFVRHDLVRISNRLLWFAVRAPTFLVFFFGVLAAAFLVRVLAARPNARLVPVAVALAALATAAERSAVLRTHFVAFDQKVHAFFDGKLPDRWFYSQPFGYADHIRVYNCYFDDTCYDLARLFFAIYPDDATIYPVSRIDAPPRPAAPTRATQP